jgi:hypothetical protein
VDPVPDPPLPRKSGSAGNRTRTAVAVAKNSDHWTTVAVSHGQQQEAGRSSSLSFRGKPQETVSAHETWHKEIRGLYRQAL